MLPQASAVSDDGEPVEETKAALAQKELAQKEPAQKEPAFALSTPEVSDDAAVRLDITL